MTDKELKELMAKGAKAHTEILKHCDEELKRCVCASAVLRLHNRTTQPVVLLCLREGTIGVGVTYNVTFNETTYNET